MPYLNLDLDYFTHPKIVRLVGLLGRESEVLPIRLWCYCGKHHSESGQLSGYGPQEVEAAVGWWGKSGVMVEAMLKIGLLEQFENGYLVHDWFEHAGHLAAFKKRAKSAAKRRWKGLATSIAKRKLKHTPYQPNQPNLHNQPKKEVGRNESDPATWLESLKLYKAYEGIDVEREYSKMQAWCDSHKKQPTKRRFVGWLNRIESVGPLEPGRATE